MRLSPARRSTWRDHLLALAPQDEVAFNSTALLLFQWQLERNSAYRRLIQQTGIRPHTLQHWSEIPAVSQTLFKSNRIAAHPPAQTRTTFRSSGTTGQPRSQHHFAALDLYRAVSTRGATLGFCPPSAPKPLFFFLTPSPRQAPDSSLARMFDFWKKEFAASPSTFWVQREKLPLAALRTAIETAIAARSIVFLCGPAFSYVPLLDAWSNSPLNLPLGSRILETGGFKGRSREIKKPTFYRQLSDLFGLESTEIWNEYGMCELSSQAYAQGPNGEHHCPPWARVLIVDPATNRPVRRGQRGLVRWIDLANIDSVLAIQTHDLARRTNSGFQLIGRLPALPLRGCSLNAETWQS